MLRIGYVRAYDPRLGARSAEDAATLDALGCQVIRTEEPDAPCGEEIDVLNSVLDFIGEGDQLVVRRLEHLAATGHGMLRILERLEARGASLLVAEPELCSIGPGGPALRAALTAVASVEPMSRGRRRPAASHEIRALQRAGVGPVEIARRLGVSRMTVWRKLKAMQA